jgi:AcrR family transcriptional regulator
MAVAKAVSKEVIIQASIDILNRGGIEGLTMRAIAKELGIKAASLYWHFSGKLELYGAIAEHLCLFHHQMPERTAETRAFLLALCHAYRAMLLSVRDAVPILENSIPNTPRRVEIIRVTSGALLEIGVRQKNLMTVSNMINNYVLSFTADEVRHRNTPLEVLRRFAASLGPGDEVIFISEQDFDEQFLYGLEILLAGIDAVSG